MLRKHLSMLYILALLMISAVAITTASASEGDDAPCVATQEEPCLVQDLGDEGGEGLDNGQERYGLRAK
jgi:hypothetical protein